jgi:hypothetical protein
MRDSCKQMGGKRHFIQMFAFVGKISLHVQPFMLPCAFMDFHPWVTFPPQPLTQEKAASFTAASLPRE